VRDTRLVEMKSAAERDNLLTDGEHRVLALVISWIYSDPNRAADHAFPLPWSWVSQRGVKISADQFYRRIESLMFKGWLRFDRLRGCPPRRWFFLCLNCRRSAVIDCRESAGFNTAKVRQLITAEKRHFYNLIPSGRNSEKRESAPQGGGAEATKPSASLRAEIKTAAGAAQERGGRNGAAGAAKKHHDAERDRELIRLLKQAAGMKA
jgi:hypothetical protein